MRRRPISCGGTNRANTFFINTCIILFILHCLIYVMKGPLIFENPKPKDYILLDPCLTYIGKSLCFFFELIYKRTSYSKRNEYLENKEKNINKIRKRDFILDLFAY